MPKNRRISVFLPSDISEDVYSRVANGTWSIVASIVEGEPSVVSSGFSMTVDRRSAAIHADEHWQEKYVKENHWVSDEDDENEGD